MKALKGYGAPILTGLLTVAAGLLPWLQIVKVNLRVRPDLPWAALVTVVYHAFLTAWLAGWGPPARSADQRRRRLRLWPRQEPDDDGIPAGAVMAMLGLLYVMWIVISRMSPIPDLSAYPTTAFRWSMFLLGGLTAGVMEEIAFRGYMQTGIERFDRENAIWITSSRYHSKASSTSRRASGVNSTWAALTQPRQEPIPDFPPGSRGRFPCFQRSHSGSHFLAPRRLDIRFRRRLQVLQ